MTPPPFSSSHAKDATETYPRWHGGHSATPPPPLPRAAVQQLQLLDVFL